MQNFQHIFHAAARVESYEKTLVLTRRPHHHTFHECCIINLWRWFFIFHEYVKFQNESPSRQIFTALLSSFSISSLGNHQIHNRPFMHILGMLMSSPGSVMFAPGYARLYDSKTQFTLVVWDVDHETWLLMMRWCHLFALALFSSCFTESLLACRSSCTVIVVIHWGASRCYRPHSCTLTYSLTQGTVACRPAAHRQPAPYHYYSHPQLGLFSDSVAHAKLKVISCSGQRAGQTTGNNIRIYEMTASELQCAVSDSGNGNR